MKLCRENESRQNTAKYFSKNKCVDAEKESTSLRQSAKIYGLDKMAF